MSPVLAQRKLNYDPFEVIEKSTENTLDFHELSIGEEEEFFVFVYGHLRVHRRYNYVLDGCNYYGKATTWEDDYILTRGPNETVKYTPEPMMFEFPTSEKELRKEFEDDFNFKATGCVEGDLYGVPLRTLTKIDSYLMNGQGVTRKKIWIDLKNNGIQLRSAQCYSHVVDFNHYREYSKVMGRLMTCSSELPAYGSRIYYFGS